MPILLYADRKSLTTFPLYFPIGVPQGCDRRVKSLFGLLQHPHLDLPGNVVGHLLGDRDFDIEHKNIVGAGGTVVDLVGTGEMDGLVVCVNEVDDLDFVEIVAGHPVGDVENDIDDLRVGLGVIDHLNEGAAVFLGTPRGFGNLPDLDDSQVPFGGVLAPEFLLGVERITFAFLFFT